MDVNDVEVSVGGDMVVTGGKDAKVKVWILQE
jgi:hypothetical protein